MIDLNPCPFCGGEPYFLKPRHEKGTAFDTMMIECKHCGALPYGVSVYDGKKEEDKKAAIAKFWNRRSNNWISVKDRLPEEIHRINYYDKVAGEASFTESDTVVCRIIYDEEIQYVTGIFTDGQWYLYHDMYNEETEELHVTHWMPLPEPPEQEGEEKS